LQSDSHLYMVLDLARRGDLRHSLRASPNARFSEKTAMHIFRQLLEALHCCHVQSILHRDIKPENILMTDTGLVKLSDFGVAKILPDLQDCRSTSGTHGYMAPEIYVGNHSHGTPSEWFSAGVTLHELLTGRRPFE
ncbi:kinase-like domain-containing protein, partial [Ochromonadaceae sp. CCMP2298]